MPNLPKELAEYYEDLLEGAKSIDTEAAYQQWLDTLAKFHQYSPRNAQLIVRQKQDASLVAGYRAWQALGRQVKKGEKAIWILSPIIKKETEEETGEAKAKLIGWRGNHVFDIAQTEGDPLPGTLTLEGEAPDQLLERLAGLIEGERFALQFEGLGENLKGVTDFTNHTVTINAKQPTAQQAKTMAHELGHIWLHDPAKGDRPESRDLLEFEAESVAYLVCRQAGLDAGAYSFTYIRTWTNSRSPEELFSQQSRILKAANEIVELAQLTQVERDIRKMVEEAVGTKEQSELAAVRRR